MAWSTQQLADLSGTTVNTIRHYHRLGILEEPERRHNGYKEYGVHDLVRLLRIRRLTDLGIPLSQIGKVSAGSDDTPQALRELDAELAATIERLQQARADIAAILAAESPADGPAGFESLASLLSEADSSIIHIYSQFYDDDAMADLRSMVETDDHTLSVEINALAPDADDATRQRLAELLAPSLARHLTDYPWLSDPAARASKDPGVITQTFVDAVVELYNPAQLDVLYRASLLANAQMPDSDTTPT